MFIFILLSKHSHILNQIGKKNTKQTTFYSIFMQLVEHAKALNSVMETLLPAYWIRYLDRENIWIIGIIQYFLDTTITFSKFVVCKY